MKTFKLWYCPFQVRQEREASAKTMTCIGHIEGNEMSEPQLADLGLVFVPFADSYTQPVGIFVSKGPTKDKFLK